MTRLETINTELTKMIVNADEDIHRKIIYETCLYAIEKSDVEEKIAQDIITSFYDKLQLKIEYKGEIEKLINKYDDEYFDLYDNGDENYIIPFQKARCFSVILYCFDLTNTGLAASEAVYEASVLTEDATELFLRINKIF